MEKMMIHHTWLTTAFVLATALATPNRPALAAATAGSYDAAKDPFYARKTIYVTWIMIWNGSTEGWWKQSDYKGTKVQVNGEWVAINWNDRKQSKLTSLE